MQRQIRALHLLLPEEKLLMGWTTTTFCRFEVAAGLSENVPYIGLDGDDIVVVTMVTVDDYSTTPGHSYDTLHSPPDMVSHT